jgi:hypothetical protein
MKKLFIPIILILVLGFSTSAYSQTATDTLSKPKYVYCQLLMTTVFETPKGRIEIDFGKDKSFAPDASYIDLVKRKIKTYSSMVDALNFMASKGWEMDQATVLTEGSYHTFHWLLKKKI